MSLNRPSSRAFWWAGGGALVTNVLFWEAASVFVAGNAGSAPDVVMLRHALRLFYGVIVGWVVSLALALWYTRRSAGDAQRRLKLATLGGLLAPLPLTLLHIALAMWADAA